KIPWSSWQPASASTTGSGGSNNTDSSVPTLNPPFAFNEAEWRNDLGFWMSHSLKGDVTPEEAEWMAAHCAAESGCEQFEKDGVTVKSNPASSAICKYQVLSISHRDEIKKFVEVGRGDYVDLSTADGCRNFAFELVMSNKASGKPFNQDWLTTRDRAKLFLDWVHSQPADKGDVNLRAPGVPLGARGKNPSDTSAKAETPRAADTSSGADTASPAPAPELFASSGCKGDVQRITAPMSPEWSMGIHTAGKAYAWTSGGVVRHTADPRSSRPPGMMPMFTEDNPFELTYSAGQTMFFQTLQPMPMGSEVTVFIRICN
ncbi:MAG: hypothetical protein WAW92_01605, partial [Minisyncoccia bacterium]